ncbi:MAG TPA: nuclear transport factor 2 family protein [Acidimicrobiales bacterium]|nr:nuclear transport factor 2 family protein [Acidimicrobiales bacterium]
MTVHPFVALMRRYCIDYTNSHDLTVCDDIMEPDYVVHISGFDLTRDESYRPAVHSIFEQAPGLGLVVHELVLNGDRLAMRFSEHASLPAGTGRALASWSGISLYRWNGKRLLECSVEQDFLARHEQLASGDPHALEAPHLDPWLTTEPVAPDPEAEATVRAWLSKGDLTAAGSMVIDDSRASGRPSVVIEPTRVEVRDLFSAGPRVAFHVEATGPYRGGLADVGDDHVGTEVTLLVAGLVTVDGGTVDAVHAVTTRMGVRGQLTGASPV